METTELHPDVLLGTRAGAYWKNISHCERLSVADIPRRCKTETKHSKSTSSTSSILMGTQCPFLRRVHAHGSHSGGISQPPERPRLSQNALQGCPRNFQQVWSSLTPWSSPTSQASPELIFFVTDAAPGAEPHGPHGQRQRIFVVKWI